MIVLIGFGIWRKLTKKESVKIARYDIPVPYKIFFYFNSSFRTVFFYGSGFLRIGSGFLAHPDPDSERKSDPDPGRKKPGSETLFFLLKDVDILQS